MQSREPVEAAHRTRTDRAVLDEGHECLHGLLMPHAAERICRAGADDVREVCFEQRTDACDDAFGVVLKLAERHHRHSDALRVFELRRLALRGINDRPKLAAGLHEAELGEKQQFIVVTGRMLRKPVQQRFAP